MNEDASCEGMRLTVYFGDFYIKDILFSALWWNWAEVVKVGGCRVGGRGVEWVGHQHCLGKQTQAQAQAVQVSDSSVVIKLHMLHGESQGRSFHIHLWFIHIRRRYFAGW